MGGGFHHKQLNMTLVKVSEGTDKPHENKLFSSPRPPNTPPSTIKYKKLQKGPPEIKKREEETSPRPAAVNVQPACPG